MVGVEFKGWEMAEVEDTHVVVGEQEPRELLKWEGEASHTDA